MGLRLVRLAAAIPVALVLAEGTNVQAHPDVPLPPAVLATAPAPLLVLPSSQELDEIIMLWTVDRFPAMVNGGSGFTPEQQRTIRTLTEHFPDPVSIDALRALGVKSVVVLRHPPPLWGLQAPPEAFDAPLDGLGVTRQDFGDAVVYTL